MEKTIEMKGMDLGMLFGPADANLKLLEDAFASKIIVRGNIIKIDGDKKEVPVIHEVFHEMGSTLNRKGSLTQDDVKALIRITAIQNGHESQQLDTVVHYGRKGAISGRTDGQNAYIKIVRKNDIVFSVGPAGTGKTYLAVAFAVAALDNREIDRIILCRPAVEAGENLGFLPGDLKEKVDPYLTPLYDALGDMMPTTRLKPLLANNTIDIIPLAYMRGRTLNNAFMILDEAQNATTMQMKMFLTRLGKNSQMVVVGDITQIDLVSKNDSGLLDAKVKLSHIKDIGFVFLNDKDVVRHDLVKKIINAYDSKK